MFIRYHTTGFTSLFGYPGYPRQARQPQRTIFTGALADLASRTLATSYGRRAVQRPQSAPLVCQTACRSYS